MADSNRGGWTITCSWQWWSCFCRAVGLLRSGGAGIGSYPFVGRPLLGTFWTLAYTHRMVRLRIRIFWISALKPGKWSACQSNRRDCAAHRSDELGAWFHLEPAPSKP